MADHDGPAREERETFLDVLREYRYEAWRQGKRDDANLSLLAQNIEAHLVQLYEGRAAPPSAPSGTDRSLLAELEGVVIGLRQSGAPESAAICWRALETLRGIGKPRVPADELWPVQPDEREETSAPPHLGPYNGDNDDLRLQAELRAAALRAVPARASDPETERLVEDIKTKAARVARNLPFFSAQTQSRDDLVDISADAEKLRAGARPGADLSGEDVQAICMELAEPTFTPTMRWCERFAQAFNARRAKRQETKP